MKVIESSVKENKKYDLLISATTNDGDEYAVTTTSIYNDYYLYGWEYFEAREGEEISLPVLVYGKKGTIELSGDLVVFWDKPEPPFLITKTKVFEVTKNFNGENNKFEVAFVVPPKPNSPNENGYGINQFQLQISAKDSDAKWFTNFEYE